MGCESACAANLDGDPSKHYAPPSLLHLTEAQSLQPILLIVAPGVMILPQRARLLAFSITTTSVSSTRSPFPTSATVA